MFYVVATISIALGAFVLFRARAIRDFFLSSRYLSAWERRLLLVPGYVGSLRLVGAAWIAFGVFVFIVRLTSPK